MRVVITGATGFIGSNLARVFLEQGAHVYALVRPGSLHLDALPVHERLHTVACDLAHVLECVLEFDFAGHCHTILSDVGGTEFFLDNDVAAFGAESYLDGIGKSVDTFLKLFASLDIKFYFFSHSIV